MADGIGGARLARNQEGLAATAAEVLLAALATFARLPHPARAAKRRKRRRHAPDIAKRVLSYIPEFEVRGFSATNSSQISECHRYYRPPSGIRLQCFGRRSNPNAGDFEQMPRRVPPFLDQFRRLPSTRRFGASEGLAAHAPRADMQ